MSLVSKLAEVMAEVERIPKRGRNDFHKYDYATEADIVAAVRRELAARHVMLIPEVTTYHHQELQPNKKGDPRDPLMVLSMTFTFMDGESGETITRPWLGVGQDGGDKGAYKAMTGGEKYFLMKTFLMPTGDDPEANDSRGDKHPATVKPDPIVKRDRPPAPEGAVYLERVIPRSRGNREWADVVFSTGETAIAIGQVIGLATAIAQEGGAVIATTSRNGKGNLQLDMVERWTEDKALDREIAAKDKVA